ncbi:aminotransferase class IV [Acuticoccus sediminis]|uniref:aminotransferase class IV n=1 Tax=Acuticoccus sediminis TaxID=2184697 RepID=UPI001CFCD3F8|nr:aminotransferase class IV [Acuticoccus sediminis]
MSAAAEPAFANQRVAYFNGKIVPESEVMVSFRDRSFKFGDGAFDMTRTFGHRPFKLKEHIDRFYQSLRYLRIDPGRSPKEMIDASEAVLERNLHLLDGGDDYWLGQRVSRGIDAVGDEGFEHTGPSVIVECTPLPLRQRARQFRDGVDIVVPAVRRTAPDALSPRAKTHNYLNLITADMDAKAFNPEALSILLDVNGNLAEGTGSNIFLVTNGEIRTPRSQFVLAGISRQTVIDLARKSGIPMHEADVDLFDALNADEIFITSTSWCIVPARTFNGNPVGGGAPVPGPVTKQLTDAYVDFVNFDFPAQYLKYT